MQLTRMFRVNTFDSWIVDGLWFLMSYNRCFIITSYDLRANYNTLLIQHMHFIWRTFQLQFQWQCNTTKCTGFKCVPIQTAIIESAIQFPISEMSRLISKQNTQVNHRNEWLGNRFLVFTSQTTKTNLIHN